MSDDVLRDYAWFSLDPHADCTCCRQWRLVEQPSAMDIPLMGTRDSWEGLRPTPLLPAHEPAPYAPLARSIPTMRSGGTGRLVVQPPSP